MNLCEDPYIATLFIVILVVNSNVCDCREQGQNWEIIDVITSFINIFLLKAIPPMFGQIPFFTSATVLMLLSPKYWKMYLCSASGVLEGGFDWVLPPTRFCSPTKLMIRGWGTRPPLFPEESWRNHFCLNNRRIYLSIVCLLSTLGWVGILHPCFVSSTFLYLR